MNKSDKKTKKNKRNLNEIKRINARLAQQSSLQSRGDRSKQRQRETEQFHEVIVKRTDETFRHADDILQLAVLEGKCQIDRPALSLFMSSCAAGMIIGFTVLAIGVLAGILGNVEGINRIFVALVYPLGFVLCILSRTELFTEHTATAVYPMLDGKTSIKKVLVRWATVIVGNLCGGIIIACLLTAADDVIHAKEGYLSIAEHVLSYDTKSLFVSAILAGWLMAIGAWTTLSTHSTSSQIMCIYIATFIIGVGGLHHSIAGSVELFVGILNSNEISIKDVIPAIALILLGNAVGGSVFVALLNYSHIRSLNK